MYIGMASRAMTVFKPPRMLKVSLTPLAAIQSLMNLQNRTISNGHTRLRNKFACWVLPRECVHDHWFGDVEGDQGLRSHKWVAVNHISDEGDVPKDWSTINHTHKHRKTEPMVSSGNAQAETYESHCSEEQVEDNDPETKLWFVNTIIFPVMGCQ